MECVVKAIVHRVRVGACLSLWLACGDSGGSQAGTQMNPVVADGGRTGGNTGEQTTGTTGGFSPWAAPEDASTKPATNPGDAGPSIAARDGGEMPESGACTNDGDRAVMASMHGDDGDQPFDAVVETCGRDNILDPSPDSTSECISERTKASATCARCYGETIKCSSSGCVTPCSVDSNSKDCKQCLCEHECPQDLATCTGLTNDQCK